VRLPDEQFLSLEVRFPTCRHSLALSQVRQLDTHGEIKSVGSVEGFNAVSVTVVVFKHQIILSWQFEHTSIEIPCIESANLNLLLRVCHLELVMEEVLVSTSDNGRERNGL